MSGRSLVHINGRTYDTSKRTPHGQSIDGFVSHRKRPARSAAPSGHVHRKVQKTYTLHRAAVKKPQQLTSLPPLNSAPHVTVSPTKSHVAIHTPKSPMVHKFVDIAPSTQTPSTTNSHASASRSTTSPRIAQPAAPPLSKSDLFIERQLRLAEAHQKQLHKKKKLRHRLMSLQSSGQRSMRIGAALVAGLAIIGFVLYQNSAGISMQIASRRAGFSAAIPSYTPGGYALEGPVAYSSGRIVLSFSSTTNDKSYQIEQQPSQWTPDILQEQVASANSGQYQTYQTKGVKIFFTGSSTATWVNNGVLYTLRGDSGLASEQIASIAASM